MFKSLNKDEVESFVLLVKSLESMLKAHPKSAEAAYCHLMQNHPSVFEIVDQLNAEDPEGQARIAEAKEVLSKLMPSGTHEEAERLIASSDPEKESVLDELKEAFTIGFEDEGEVKEEWLTGLVCDERTKKAFAARSDRWNWLKLQHDAGIPVNPPRQDSIYLTLDSIMWIGVRKTFHNAFGFQPKMIGVRAGWTIAIPKEEVTPAMLSAAQSIN